MRPLLTAALVFAHCGAPMMGKPKCVSECGMILLEPTTSSWTCKAFQDTETRALAMFKAHSKDARLWQCGNKLNGYYVVEKDVQDWFDHGNGVPVVGLTNCDERTITVAWMAPEYGALTHEMAHALQGCQPLPPFDDTDFDHWAHSNWLRDGIYEAIEAEKELP
jgi:hypothetical protein